MAAGYTWDVIKANTYFVDGSLRDIFVNDITEDEWGKWVDFINAAYEIDWDDKDKVDYEVIKARWKKHESPGTAKLFIGNIQINTHFFGDFENDIDPREVNTEYDHACILDYMKSVSELLGKEVYLSEENTKNDYLVKVHRGEIEYNLVIEE
ncbi:MAG: hypothetical protein LBO07_07155 [Coriobacteriales bacterium]|jgi:hypothetical protein|nr:hypothetical protein [Coriobacteriales bacterium]